MRLELVPLPVSDVDRAILFYRDVVGFVLDHDVSPGNGMRVVQLTPPGSACSISFGVGMGAGTPVSNLQLAVDDLDAVRADLAAKGLEVSPVQDMGGGVRLRCSPGAPVGARFLNDPVRKTKKAPAGRRPSRGVLVDLRGFEPLTSSMRTRRATNCATGPETSTTLSRRTRPP